MGVVIVTYYWQRCCPILPCTLKDKERILLHCSVTNPQTQCYHPLLSLDYIIHYVVLGLLVSHSPKVSPYKLEEEK